MARLRSADIDRLVEGLAFDELALLVSVDANHAPNVAAISWLKGASGGTVHALVSRKARLLRSLAQHPWVSLVIFRPPRLYALAGEMRVVSGPLPGLPLPLMHVCVEVRAVYDPLFAGGRLIHGPAFRRDPAPRLPDLTQRVARCLEGLAQGRWEGPVTPPTRPVLPPPRPLPAAPPELPPRRSWPDPEDPPSPAKPLVH